MKAITTGSDFSGVGAFDYAIQRVSEKKGFNHKRIYACDWDKYARITYSHNHGVPDYYPHDVYEREIPSEPLDIYMTSPPCQAFSLAGKRKGETDKRGVLFYNSLEFIQKNNPRFFIFENVKGLLSDDNGKTFGRWCDLLGGKSVNGSPVMFPNENGVPYHIYFRVLNSKNYGVPQNRERIFTVGIRDDQDNNFRWPKEEHLEKRLKDVLETEVDAKYFLSDEMVERVLSPTLSTNKGEGIKLKTYEYPKVAHQLKGGKWDRTHEQNGRCYDVNGIGATLHTTGGGNQEPKICIPVLTPNRPNKRQNGRRFKENDDPSFTLTAQDQHGIYDGFKIRRLTPRECFRLQDFPDTFDFSVVSNSQAYKQAGNSITVRVLELILEKLSL